VQEIADRVALVRAGRLELVETVDALRRRAVAQVEVTFAAPPPADAVTSIPGVRELSRHGRVVRFALEGTVDALVKALARFDVHAIDSHEADLEDVFLALYRGGDDAR
jgi:ABC-2 type transport system ATP-binding protein